ncbi:GPW/gp25 family protein [Xenorhabdus sp. 42]|uniref:GPW/gp25 family protein n=1 Tax=Xenorhabdus szentirmaii TaxID=290112 RepID=A0AAW3YTZ7_9GAMM|nr:MULTISPECIES: GPW/gp25 family protein [unclassified Xenorhabdus]MBD2779872.1 GPW/gp25 family protein [Xenorhabdus sp. 38]MBD2793512.1 GPW/gp25 family protein [Xenorhabdus sp. CUL]MBD2800237.1 GPW/gp25 family protein [Xenorhabdus sp. M]MBD2806340.1 GPW/gp25 family protein [Xenorhabdus sp. ZM]MBD2819872.1 GPW/gp25 family protein [Xenorhabdus sp. 42]
MMYLGMNRQTGRTLTDLAHVRQSISDILLTPVGSRIARRTYGSLLPELIDWPQNPALRLQVMAASYTAISRWEPRVALTSITMETGQDGKMVVDITGTYHQSTEEFSLSIPVKHSR